MVQTPPADEAAASEDVASAEGVGEGRAEGMAEGTMSCEVVGWTVDCDLSSFWISRAVTEVKVLGGSIIVGGTEIIGVTTTAEETRVLGGTTIVDGIEVVGGSTVVEEIEVDGGTKTVLFASVKSVTKTVSVTSTICQSMTGSAATREKRRAAIASCRLWINILMCFGVDTLFGVDMLDIWCRFLVCRDGSIASKLEYDVEVLTFNVKDRDRGGSQ